ncbi:MAG: YebC/PmpR family DNA-binding transcriptional regulator [Acidobacteria bacterium]|nr:YebC/PmpR family DNA-binding transcriptional regulator [Acidobacteriota bacterium]
MSGHSKWHSIKHKKGAADAKRGRVFTRLIKELSVAARQGGGDPSMNPRLRTVISAAQAANMPKDNITKAIQRGTGELPGVTYEEVTYEGYGPGGVAIYVEALTDNKNRTVAELRHLFSKNSGNLAENGSVAWMFHRKGYIIVEKGVHNEDDILLLALDAGAEDVREDGENFEVFTPPDKLEAVKETFEKNAVKITLAEVQMIPQNAVHLTGKPAHQCVGLMEAIEEHEDVQKVWMNADLDPSVLEAG